MLLLSCSGFGEAHAAGALFSGASEQSRDDAAVELLLRDDKASREILLEALLSKDNSAARQAVCRGLISSRALGAVVRNRNDFREGLVGILVDEGGLDAQLAAEAMLVFKYREISSRLEKLVRFDEVDRRIRLNVVYALKIRPDKEAMSELIRLLDDGDVEISGAAESALQDSFGIPVGTDKEVWSTILKDLQRKSPNEIRRERLLQQETRMRKLQGELALWRRLYIAGLDKEYDRIDETARGVLLFERLGSELTAVKLWALIDIRC
jgi:F0F1-type ATP synthase membrane subunit c/vacuolar-type H+-ATPase subunit K